MYLKCTIGGNRMTEQELRQYKAVKNEILDLNRRIEETKQTETVSLGTVRGSSSHFPYIPQTFKVVGIEPEDMVQKQKEVSKLLKQREAKRDELLKIQKEIEDYINGIPDSITRMIFRMYFLDGLNQIEIGRKAGYDQGTVSRKIKNYLKLHKMHNKKW